MSARYVLDLSRTLSRAAHPVPTGIDRVELAYAEWLLRHRAERTDFVAVHPWGGFALLPRRAATRFVADVGARWRGGDVPEATIRAAAARLRRSVLFHAGLPWPAGRGRGFYLLTSHHHLDKPGLVAAMRRRIGPMLCFVHDLIPIAYPEYARPGQPERHARRMRTAAALSDLVAVNSADTGRDFASCLASAGRAPPVLVAPLGVDGVGGPARLAVSARSEPPYFLCVGTIEPRKNHLLLLHLWRQLAAEPNGAAPRLLLVGRRGWENEQVLDLLERCPALRGAVIERNDIPDLAMRGLLAGARALLLPSFAEGYGLPLAEALACGLPVLCSDLPALREVGGAVPEYLDPLDGPAWRQAVLDYLPDGSPRRAAQLARLAGWEPPGWDRHMRLVTEGLDALPPVRP